jgi:hypothetical protein
VTPVEPERQLEFLSNIQRLLGERQFTVTYKYALLLALADICVEEGNDDGAPFVIQRARSRKKFIAYYWPQIRPYEGVVLRQNMDLSMRSRRFFESVSAPTSSAATHPLPRNRLMKFCASAFDTSGVPKRSRSSWAVTNCDSQVVTR